MSEVKLTKVQRNMKEVVEKLKKKKDTRFLIRAEMSNL